MEIRKTQPNELDPILSVYEYARQFMQKSGNKNQWIDGYPTREIVETDIRNGHSYTIRENEKLLGVFSLMPGPEPNYQKIYQGKWLNDEPYGVIHRLAAAPGVRGIGTYCIDWCSRQYKNTRVDTHRDNLIMQKILQRNGFIFCGRIRIKNGSERMAYQKVRL